MQKHCTIQVDGKEWAYLYKRRRGQKKLTLSVKRDGSITVTVPWWVSHAVAERYLFEKWEWLENALAKVDPLSPRERVGVRGGVGEHQQVITVRKEEKLQHYTQYKERARILVHERLPELNAHYGFVYGRVAIRKNATSWGSCSSKKNLNFDYRILFLPPHLQDYLLVHELCHLKEMNHSPRFWALVAQVVPEYKMYRRELRAVRR